MDIRFNNKTDNFETLVEFNDKSYSLSLSGLAEGDMDRAKLIISNIVIWIKENLEITKEYITSKLIDLKNDTWLEEGEKVLTLQEFKGRIDIDGIIVFGDGSFQIFFFDDDIFWGHGIAVDVNSDFSFDVVNLVG